MSDDDELGLTAPIEETPSFLNRLEIFRSARDLELSTEMVVKRLQEIMNGPSDANALRAIEQLRKLSEKTEEDGRVGGRTTINGNVNFGADVERLNAVLKTVDAAARREILDALAGGDIIDAEIIDAS